ncbi:MAG: dTDP-4-dehydrorhamnose 3,5-epimerase [Candidatus Hydrogenedentota bacterium]
MGLTIESCEIPDILEVTSDLFPDDRGYFTEFHNEAALRDSGFEHTFVQDNLSRSSKGVLRGLHYQLNPHAQGKLVRCITGAIFDVAVDIRQGSPTYGQHVTRELSADQGNALWVPEGFAHGFLSLQDDTFVMYKCTAGWANGVERTIRYDDPALEITWPSEPTLVNAKDLDGKTLSETENNFTFKS